MGIFDRFRSKASAPATEAPSLKTEASKDQLVRDEKNNIVGIENVPSIPLSVAREYVKTQYKVLAEELEDLRKSGLPAKDIDAKIVENSAKAAQLKVMQDQITAQLESPDARKLAHEGKETAIVNPYFTLGSVGAMEAANDNASETPSVEDLEAEVAGMKTSHEALATKMRSLEAQRDEMMRGLKGMHLPEEVVGTYAQIIKPPEIYGHPQVELTKADYVEREAYKMAEDTRTEKRESGVGEKLREVLDQIDDLKEASAVLEKNIGRKEQNLDFVRRNTAPTEKREAA